MEIKIEIDTRGDRLKFRKTYTREFLEDKGLMQLNNDSGPYSPWAVHTKLGWMCSFSDHDVLTYMGHGIWDLRVHKPSEDMEHEYKAEELLPSIEHEIKVRSKDGRDQK